MKDNGHIMKVYLPKFRCGIIFCGTVPTVGEMVTYADAINLILEVVVHERFNMFFV